MVSKIRKILYATDLSKNSSTYLLSYALDMAIHHKASITILHVIEPHHDMSYAGKSVDAVMKSDTRHEQDSSREEITKRLMTFCKKTEADIGAPCVDFIGKILVPIGHPVNEILKTADEEGCDVLILGTHKKGFLSKAFLGSVARSVLESSRKPVFIIPLPSEETYTDQFNI